MNRRLSVCVTLLFVACVSNAEPLHFSTSFARDLMAKWTHAKDTPTDRERLVTEVQALFDVDRPPTFPGVAGALSALSGQTDLASPDVLFDATRIACVISECPSLQRLYLIKSSLLDGNMEGATAHSVNLVSDAGRHLMSPSHWPTGGQWTIYTILIGAALILVFLVIRYSHCAGTALSGNLPFLSRGAIAFFGVAMMLVCLAKGHAVGAVIFPTLCVLPFLTQRESIAATLGVTLLLSPYIVLDFVEQTNSSFDSVDSVYFSTSSRQRANADFPNKLWALEQQIIDDIRLGDSNFIESQFEYLYSSKTKQSMHPNLSSLWNLFGIHQATSGQHESSLDLFREAHELNPTAYQPIYNMVKTLKTLGRDQEANDALALALSLDATAVGSRVEREFNLAEDLKGYAILSGPKFTLEAVSAFLASLWSEYLKFLGSHFKANRDSRYALLYACFLIGVTVCRRIWLLASAYLPCVNCGKHALTQIKLLHEERHLCGLCDLDVVGAASLTRVVQQRHTNSIRSWQSLDSRINPLLNWLCPPYLLLREGYVWSAWLWIIALVWLSRPVFSIDGGHNIIGNSDTWLGLAPFLLAWLSCVVTAKERRTR